MLRHKSKGVTALVPGLALRPKPSEMPTASLRPIRSSSISMYLRLPSPRNGKSGTTRRVGRAQTTADQGLDNAATAQSLANKAQSTADQGVATAQTASLAAAVNTVAVQAVNKRISDLSDYVTVDRDGSLLCGGQL